MISLIILHGSSAVGKSYLMNRMVSERPAFVGWEMDDCKYWLDYPVTLSYSDLSFTTNRTTRKEFEQFKEIFALGPDNRRRCIDFLLQKIGSLLVGNYEASREVLLTVGALPPPVRGDRSVYSWLSERAPVSFFHILVDVPEQQHVEQMKRRGRLHLREEILANNSQRLLNRSQHDAVVSDFEGLKSVLERRRPARSQHLVSPFLQHKERRSMIRVHKAGELDLDLIQVFGERNSGTNHLKRLVTRYMKDAGKFLGSYASKADPVNKARVFGYKHYYPRPEKIGHPLQRSALFLVIYKNPYTWIRSTLEKPYHFSDSLRGRAIVELPDIPLEGRDARGNRIPDVDPATGEAINIFELRKHKIASWEGLAGIVDNVVFLNYETLLVYPTEVVQEIVTNFPSLFSTQKVDRQEPDPKYVKKYLEPDPFAPEEMAVMDANLSWEFEEMVGYRRDNLVLPGL